VSYILDALRRADAERERDPSRGIHAQPAAALPRYARAPREPWVLAGVAVLVAMAGAYLLAGPTRERAETPAVSVPAAVVQPVPSTPPVPAVVPVAAAVLPPPPPPPVPAVQRTVQRPILAASDQGVVRGPVLTARLGPTAPAPGVTSPDVVSPPAGATPAPAPAPARAPSAAPSNAPSTAPATAPSTAPTTGPSAAPSGAAPARGAAAPDRIVAVSELPADVQRELPKLVIAGGVHSENAAQRMLIVGGQVRSEGAELAPGLVLEQIRANSAVLRFRGWRYSVSF
jgi:general secretion pathway protein B